MRVVSSTRSGMGKSLYIQRMAEDLRICVNTDNVYVTVPIHGPNVTPNNVLKFLQPHMEKPHCVIYHFDVAPTVSMHAA